MLQNALALALGLALASQTLAIEGTDGYLLATKELANSEVVSGRELSIKYSIFNVGDSPVVDVALTDDALNSEPFVVVSGLTSIKFGTIEAGGNATHSVVVKPMISAYETYAFTGAKVEYRASEESEEVQVATTSAPGLIEVMSYEEFARNTSPHFAEWITFLMLCMIPLGIPYMMYTNSVAQFKVKSA